MSEDAQFAAEQAYPIVSSHGISYRNVEMEQAFLKGWQACLDFQATLEEEKGQP